MSYEVFILRRAQKELAALPKTDYERMRDAIVALAENPRPAGCKKIDRTGRLAHSFGRLSCYLRNK